MSIAFALSGARTEVAAGYGPCPHGGKESRPRGHRSFIVGLNSVFNRGCDYRTLTRTGIHWQRIELAWATVEPRPGHWDWSRYDFWIGTSARSHFTVLPILMGSPSWAARSYRTIPPDPSAYGDFVAHVAARYGPGGTFWRTHPRLPRVPIRWVELWNEPYFFQYSDGGPDPAKYARLVKAAAIAGRRANPHVKFLLSADIASQFSNHAAGPWVGPMYAAVPNLNRYFDGVAAHPYSFTQSPEHFTPGNSRGDFRRIQQLHAMLAAHGAGRKPFWLTEIGWSTCPGGIGAECVSPPTQADYLRRMFRIVRTDYSRWVRAVFVYNYRDYPPFRSNDKEHWFGLFHDDGSAKPAWNVVKSVAAG